MKHALHTLLSAALLLPSLGAFAWGQTGHRTVGEICKRHLTPAAAKGVADILQGDLLAEVSTWPDYIKSEDAWDFAKPWHYINIDPKETMDEVLTTAQLDPQVNNIMEALELMEGVLQDDSTSEANFRAVIEAHDARMLNGSLKATALAFFIHLMGDLHQPLHAGMAKDRGGNDVDVLFFREERNLHSVWDSGIIDRELLSFTEWAAFIDDHSPAEVLTMSEGGYTGWLQESIEARKAIYDELPSYRTDSNSGLPSLYYEYQHDYLPLVEQRLAAAGIRAAAVLNAVFAD